MPTKLVRAVEAVSDGELYFSPRAARHTYTRLQSDRFARLTARDVEVVRMIAQGLTVQECASHLGVTDPAIYRIRRKLRDVLGVRTSEQIVQAAALAGLLDEAG